MTPKTVLPACEVGMCFFRASVNLGGKWVCEHHAPAEAAYYGKYRKPHREAKEEVSR